MDFLEHRHKTAIPFAVTAKSNGFISVTRKWRRLPLEQTRILPASSRYVLGAADQAISTSSMAA
jgi:hypothetical protein